MSVEVSEVSRSFRGTLAVSRMSMSVPAGSITGLVGPNGAGKTTLLLMLAALLRPDSGTIRVAGLDPVTQPREVHLAVGWMPDAFGTWDSLTCTEILSTFAAAQGLGAASVRERTHEVLEAVHLTDMADAPAQMLVYLHGEPVALLEYETQPGWYFYVINHRVVFVEENIPYLSKYKVKPVV